MRLNPNFPNYLPPVQPGAENPLNNRATPTNRFPRADAWIVLMHELGHQLPQLQLTDPTVRGPGGNPAGVNLILENTCRRELGVPPRGGYPNQAGVITPPPYGGRTLPNNCRLEARPQVATRAQLDEAEGQLKRLRDFYERESPYDTDPIPTPGDVYDRSRGIDYEGLFRDVSVPVTPP